jgi:hypothetical protein
MIAEKNGQGTLLLPSIFAEIKRIQSIPKCPLCGRPLAEAATEVVVLPNDFGYKHPHEIHTICLDNYEDEMNWKLLVYMKFIQRKKDVPA